jgi:hypothetical protein
LLIVEPFSDVEGSPDASIYSLGEDPITCKSLKEGTTDSRGVTSIEPGQQEFYKIYGMPPLKDELKYIPHR